MGHLKSLIAPLGPEYTWVLGFDGSGAQDVFRVPVALSGNHRVIYIFTCLQRWVRTRKQKEWIVEVLDVYSVFFRTPVVPWHGDGSGVNVLLVLHLQAKLQSFRCGNVCAPRKQNTSRPLRPGYMDWPKLKRLRFRHPLTLERIQADLETFAISYGIRTHIDQMTASSCVDNEPDESQMRTFSAQLE